MKKIITLLVLTLLFCTNHYVFSQATKPVNPNWTGSSCKIKTKPQKVLSPKIDGVASYNAHHNKQVDKGINCGPIDNKAQAAWDAKSEAEKEAYYAKKRAERGQKLEPVSNDKKISQEAYAKMSPAEKQKYKEELFNKSKNK